MYSTLYLFYILFNLLIYLSISLSSTDVKSMTSQAILGNYGAAPYAALASGNGFNCAILYDGYGIACWGRNDNGRLARHNNEQNIGISTTVATKDTHLKFTKDTVKADAIFAGDCYAGAIVKQPDQPIGPSEPGDVLLWGCCNNGVCGRGLNQNLGDNGDKLIYPNGLIRMPNNRKVLAVGAGPFHLCAILNKTSTALRQDVVCWGKNNFGQLGRGDTKDIGDTDTVENIGKIIDLNNRNIVDVCAGIGHTCALDDTGTMNCWGLNTAGQLGIGSTIYVGRNSSNVQELMPSNPLTYVDVGNGLKVMQIACGYTHTCALLSDGSLRCWGNSTMGQTGYGRTENVSAVRETLPSLMGPIYLPPGSKAIAIFAGSDSSAALLDIPYTNQRLLVWGNNNRGQLGLGHIRNIGDDELPGDGGGAIPWFGNVEGRMPYFASIGTSHMCVIVIWGQVMCVGSNTYGELGIGSNTDIGDNERASGGGIVALPSWMVLNYTDGILPDQISAGSSFTCAILDNRISVACWGRNNEGNLGYGFRNTSGTAAEQSIVPPGKYVGTSTPPFLNFGGLPIMRITTGVMYGCAIRVDNKIFCWGRNGAVALGCGRGSESDIVGDDDTPLACGPYFGVGRLPLQVACSGWMCATLLEDGSIYAWGQNDNNILGVDCGSNRCSSAIPMDKNRGKMLQISISSDGLCTVREVGGFFCTGPNYDYRWGQDPWVWNDNMGFIKQMSNNVRSTAVITSDNKLAITGKGDMPYAGALGLVNANNYAIWDIYNLRVNVGGTGIVLGMFRTWLGTCYITSDNQVRCWGHPVIVGTGLNTVIGDNEPPSSQSPLVFPPSFGTVVYSLSSSYSSSPDSSICMIGTNGQPACWGAGGSFRLGGSLTEDNCGDTKAMATCSLVNMGIGNSVGYYPPTVLSIRPLPFPEDIPNVDSKGTVFEIEAKHIGLSRLEPKPLTAWLGDTGIGCDSLTRLSPSKLFCSLSPATLQEVRSNIAATSPDKFYFTLTWGSATAAQPVTNLGVLTTFTEPTITAVTPNIISTILQQRITITGTGFGKTPNERPRAWIDKYECISPLWISETSMSCLTPLSVGANLSITVTVSGNVYPSKPVPNLISYIRPNITSISPTIIRNGGEMIHIRGFGYGYDRFISQRINNISIWIDDSIPCFGIEYISDDYLRCNIPNTFAKQNVGITVMVGGQNVSSIESGITISVEYPMVTNIIPSIVYSGDNGDTHDFIVAGINFLANSNLYIYGNLCPSFQLFNSTTAKCTGISVYNFNQTNGIYITTNQNVKSNVYTTLLTVLVRAKVLSIVPPAARIGTAVLIEGSTLGYVPLINISNVWLGLTPCRNWRYSTIGTSILCTVGEGRGDNVPIKIAFTDGPNAYVVPGVNFTYINDLNVQVSWSSQTMADANSELSLLPLPSLPTNPIYITPAPVVVLVDDQGLPLTSNVARSLQCTIFMDETASLMDTKIFVNGNANSLNTRLFGKTTVTGTINSSNTASIAVFDMIGVTGSFGTPLLLQVTCGIPVTGPFFTTPVYLNTSIAKINPYFQTLPNNGEIIPSTNDLLESIVPNPIVGFRIYNGKRRTINYKTYPNYQELILNRSLLSYLSCTLDALTPSLAANYLSQPALFTMTPYRLLGLTIQPFSFPSSIPVTQNEAPVIANFSKLGIIAPFSSPIVFGTTCLWITQETLRTVADNSINMMNISIFYNSSTNNPKVIRYNAEFILPVVQVRVINQSDTSISTVPLLSRAKDIECTLSVKQANNNDPVPYFGGLPLPYNLLSGQINFKPLSVQPVLQISSTNTDPLSVVTDPLNPVQVPAPYTISIAPICYIKGQQLQGAALNFVLQRLQLIWVQAPPIAFMPSSCGRSTNSSIYLGGILDATSGKLSDSGNAVIDALAPISPSLPTVVIGLQDYDTNALAEDETGGICSMSISNVTYSTKIPKDQRRSVLGGTTVVYTVNGKATFQGVTIHSPMGSIVTLYVECSRAQGGGRSLVLSTPIAMMDGTITWSTTPSVSTKVLTNNQAISVYAIPVPHNRTTSLKMTLKIREPTYLASWSLAAGVTVRDFQPGMDPPTVCTLVLSNNGIVTTVGNGKIAVPLDTSTTKLFLRTATTSSTSSTILADSTSTTTVSGWTLNGNNGDALLTFQLVAPLDTPVAVQAMCTIGATILYSDPIPIVATAAKVGFGSSLTNIPYALIPSFPEDPIKVPVRTPFVSFGLLMSDGVTFITSTPNTPDNVPIGCTLSLVENSVTLSATSQLELSSCDSNVLLTGGEVVLVDPVTGLATFPNVYVDGPLGARFTLRASCMRPYIDPSTISADQVVSPISKVDTSVVLSDVEVVWYTAEGVGMDRTRLGSSVVLQAETTLRIIVKLNWVLPVLNKPSSFIRMEMNESTLTPSLSISCSLRVPDRQVRTSSIYFETHEVAPYDDGTVAFQVRLQEPLGYPFTMYADCLLPKKQTRSTTALTVILVSPSPIPRRAAFSANPSLSSTNTAASTPGTTGAASTPSTVVGGTTPTGPTVTASPTITATITPTSTISPSGTSIIAGGTTATPTRTTSRTVTSTPSPTPSVLVAAVVEFGMDIPSIPITDIDAIFASMQTPEILKEFSKGVLTMLTDITTSKPTSARITTITNSRTAEIVHIPMEDSVYDASSIVSNNNNNRRRNLQSNSNTGTLSVTIVAAYHDPSVTQNIVNAVQSVFSNSNSNIMSNYLGSSFSMIQQSTGITMSSILSSCCAVNTSNIMVVIAPSVGAVPSNTTTSSAISYIITYVENASLLLVAAILGSILVFVLIVWMYTSYRTRKALIDDYRTKRENKKSIINSKIMDSSLSKQLLETNYDGGGIENEPKLSNAKQWEYTAQVLEHMQKAIQQQDAAIIAQNARIATQQAQIDAGIRSAWTDRSYPNAVPPMQSSAPTMMTTTTTMGNMTTPVRIISGTSNPTVGPVIYQPGTILEVSYGKNNNNTSKNNNPSHSEIDNVLFNVPQY